MRAFVLALALATPALAAKPVARPLRGSLDALVVTDDSTGVLVRFLSVSRAQAQAGLDAIAPPGGWRVGFLKTPQSSIAAIYLTAGEVTVARLRELAAACSQLKGAVAAYAFLHPAARNQDLEAEAVWTYEAGQLKKEQRLAWRDNEAWGQWARKRLQRAELDARKWPGWPLSELAVSLGIPGRDFLERPMALLELAAAGFPRDVGQNLVLTTVYVPEATLLEIRQLAETQHASESKVVQDTFATEKLSLPVDAASRAPWDDADKASMRELPLFLTRDVFNAVDTRAVEEVKTFSKVVEHAWRQAHPFVAPKKSR